MRVARERGPVSFQDQDKGAEPGASPVRDTLQSAEARLQGDPPLARAVAEALSFHTAEAGWLGAMAAWHALISDPARDVDRAAEAAIWEAERGASRTFALAPLPTLLDLPRKLCLIEREAFEVAHHDMPGRDLAVWLAALRLDLMRLLARPDGAVSV
ncbi:MAG: hypothetical protein K2X00_11170 [Nitrospiraceae bacterium]|nr:hypothetical protein [Nitrospiraceae bacterium]